MCSCKAQPDWDAIATERRIAEEPEALLRKMVAWHSDKGRKIAKPRSMIANWVARLVPEERYKPEGKPFWADMDPYEAQKI